MNIALVAILVLMIYGALKIYRADRKSPISRQDAIGMVQIDFMIFIAYILVRIAIGRDLL